MDGNAKYDGGFTALFQACQVGHLEVVREFLEHTDKVNVNAQQNQGGTALYIASQVGHTSVVRVLLEHNDVDVNLPMDDGGTALMVACEFGHMQVVRALLERNDVNVSARKNNGSTALDEARAKGYDHIVHVLKVGQDRKSLAHVMTSNTADPVELSLDFIKECKTLREIGSGAFGKVSLVEDSHLQKKFAVKKMNLSRSDQDTVDEIRESFQREVSVRYMLCRECCLIWNNEPLPCPPRVLTIRRTSARNSSDFVIPISLSCTHSI